MGGNMQRFRTRGGWHIELEVPLSKKDRLRVDDGDLTPVDSDGNPLEGAQREKLFDEPSERSQTGEGAGDPEHASRARKGRDDRTPAK